MEAKKNPQVDLSRKSNFFFNIGLVVSLLLVIIAFEWKSNSDSNLLERGLVVDVIDELVVIPLTIQEPPKPKEPKLISLPDDEIDDEEIISIIDIEMTDETVIEKLILVDPIEDEKVEETFTLVEESATFKGGIESFYKYVGKNLKYPPQAQRMRLEGKIYIEFVVKKDGSISEVKILRGIGGGCDEEAIRVLKKSPLWSPGRQRGKAVRQRMVLPITFKLQ